MDHPASPGAELRDLLRPAWAEIDLDALQANLALMRELLGPAQPLAVVKADAYGHGAAVVGRFLDRWRVPWLGVALLEEAAQLRREGIGTSILVLGTAGREQLPLYRRLCLTPTVSSLEQVELWCSGTREWPEVHPVHLKVDTGMTRLGVLPAELPEALRRIRAAPGIRLEGFLSHLADADLPASPRSEEQESLYRRLVEELSEEERSRAVLHLTNSAGALHFPPSHNQLARLGLSLYGLDPRGEEQRLRPVMSVVARIVQVKEVEAGCRVGYGGTWTAARASRLAVVPVGYADGYPRLLSNRARMIVRGAWAPVVGAVSMDMCAVDVTDSGGGVGDEVVLMGARSELRITAADLAAQAETIPYEVLCLLGLRLPRRYRYGGEELAAESRLSPR